MSNRTVTVALKAQTSEYEQALRRSTTVTNDLHRSVQRASGSGSRDLQTLGRSSRAAGGELAGLGSRASTAGSTVERSMARTSRATRETQGALAKAKASGQEAFKSLGSGSSLLGVQLTGLKGTAVGAGAAIGAAFAYSVGQAVEFDKQMHNVNSISGLSQQAMHALGDQVIGLSKTLPQSASTLAAGLYDVASSGFQGADGMTVLKASAVSASAGMTDTATAAQAITAVLNAYGLSASQAGDVSDQLFQTVNLGVTNFESLAHNVGDYIGQAKALGLSFAQTQSAIATLTLTGTTQAQAGTALGSVLNSLIRPQQGLQDALHGIGFESGTAALKSLGLRGTLMKLSEATGGSAEKMGQLFTDSQALRSVLQLTSNGGEKWASVAAKIESPTQRAGAAQKALAEQSKSLAYQLEVAKNRVDAAAIAVGSKLLPVLAQGLGAAFDLGGKLAAGLEPLLPAFADLASALEHLISIGGDLAGQFAPLAAVLAKLAMVPVVVLFTSLAKALEVVTGVAADHKTVVMALAIAYGITLLGGVERVAVAISVQMVMALHRALEGLALMTAGAGGAGAALRGLATSGTAATLGLAAAIAVGITAWNGYNSGVHEAKDGLEKLKAAMAKPGDIKGFVDANTQVDALRTKLRSFVTEQQNKPWYTGIFDIGGNAKAAGIIGQLDNLDAAAAKNDLTFRKFKTAVEGVLEAGAGPNADAFHNTMVLTGKAFEDSVPMLEAAGVKVGDTFGTIQTKLAEYKRTSTGAAGGSKLVTTALSEIASGAADTATAVDKLKQGLDALIGVYLSSDEAAIQFESALDNITTTLKKNGHTLDINTEAGRANKSAIIDAVKALSDKVQADAAAGASADSLSRTLSTGRARLIAQATAAGLSKTAMEALLRQYHLTPAQVQTIIKAAGVPAAVAAVKAVRRELDTLKSRTVVIDVRSKAPVTTGVRTVGGDNAHYAGGLVTGPGTATSDSIAARLSNGEFVVRASVAGPNLGFLNALNAGTVRPAMYRPSSAAPATRASSPSAAGAGLHIGEINVTKLPGETDEHAIVREMQDLTFMLSS